MLDINFKSSQIHKIESLRNVVKFFFNDNHDDDNHLFLLRYKRLFQVIKYKYVFLVEW